MVGCVDQEAAQRAEKQAVFEKAVSLVGRAEQGYRPPGDVQGLSHATLEEYQRAKLADAAAELASVAKSPSAQQRIAAKLLLADLHASAGRVALRDAMNAWADLSNRSAELVQYLIAIDRAQARAISLSVDDAPLIRKLEDDRDRERRLIGEQSETKQELEKQIQALKDQIAGLEKQRQEKIAAAQTLREQAFTKSGDAQYDLYDKASDTDREAFLHGAQADRRRAKLDVYESELTVLNRRNESGESFIASLEEQIADTKDRGKTLRASAAQAGEQQGELIKTLMQKVDELAGDYDQQVNKNLARAVGKITEAITEAQSAVKDAGGSDEEVKLQLLGKQMTLVHVWSSQVMITGDLGRTLGMVSTRAQAGDPPLIAQHIESLGNSVSEIGAQQSAQLGKAMAAVDEADALATELVNSSTAAVSADADAYKTQLAGYRRRMEELRLPGVQVPQPEAETEIVDDPAADTDSDDAGAATEDSGPAKTETMPEDSQ